jgi:hypothetical protein
VKIAQLYEGEGLRRINRKTPIVSSTVVFQRHAVEPVRKVCFAIYVRCHEVFWGIGTPARGGALATRWTEKSWCHERRLSTRLYARKSELLSGGMHVRRKSTLDSSKTFHGSCAKIRPASCGASRKQVSAEPCTGDSEQLKRAFCRGFRLPYLAKGELIASVIAEHWVAQLGPRLGINGHMNITSCSRTPQAKLAAATSRLFAIGSLMASTRLARIIHR